MTPEGQRQPTEAEVRKFWEWCGLVHVDNYSESEIAIVNSCEAMMLDKPFGGWYKPDYTKGTSELVSLKTVPNINLNNIFKYAVPKLMDDGITYLDIQTRRHIIPNEGFRNNYTVEIWSDSGQPTIRVIKSDPALALFWAIMEVINATPP